MPAPELGEEPPSGTMSGYNQTYIIKKAAPERTRIDAQREVLFKCGNWCYTGTVTFNHEVETINSIPFLIPELQRQQGKLGFYCSAVNMPEDSEYYDPLELVKDATEFIAKELSSDKICEEIDKWGKVFSWMDDDKSKTYFEVVTSAPDFMSTVSIMASKTYARGLVLIMVYFEGNFYIVMEDGEGDQPLLDIRFPDVSQHGQGLHIQSYSDMSLPWRKLTLWQSLAAEVSPAKAPAKENLVVDLSSDSYMQTYVILAKDPKNPSAADDPFREAMFRFGSWCYAGRVQLTPTIGLADIPHVIPVLRMQQNQLDYLCDVSNMPKRSAFSKPMEAMMKVGAALEGEIMKSEEVLGNLIQRLSQMGFGENISEWLDGDSKQSFFEFQVAQDPDNNPYKEVELVASKCYHPTGVVTITIYFRGIYYVVLSEGESEQPLLDSRFPDVSEKGRGYQLQSYPDGAEGWKDLRKVSIWQTAASLRAQMDKAQTKLEDLRSAKGQDAAEAARIELGRMEMATTEALRIGPTTSEDKASSSSSLQRLNSKSSGGTPKSTGPSDLSALGRFRSESSPRAQAKDDGGEPNNNNETDPSVVVKKAGLSAAKPLLNTKVALPHHVAPLQASSDLQEKLRQLQNNLGVEEKEAPWDARGRPLGKGSSFKK